MTARKDPSKEPRKSPVEYSLELAEKICELIIDGETLRDIAKMPGMPNKATILKWAELHGEFKLLYVAARDASSDSFEAEAIDKARKANKDNAAAARVLVDTLKWAAACRSPKKYGSRVMNEHTGADGGSINFSNLTDQELEFRIAQLAAAAKN